MTFAASQVGVIVCLLIAAASWAKLAQAHEDTDTSHTGSLQVGARQTASVLIEGSEPGDTMQWNWAARTAEASNISAELLWTDISGQEHAASAEQAGQTFGTFVVPQNYAGARLVWINSSDAPATVEWSYGSSAPFWRRPSMFLPAMIPILLIPVAYLAGRYVDRVRSKPATP